MGKVAHHSDTCGRSLYDWSDNHHGFNFDRYYDPERIHFGTLRVLNDDHVASGKGFQTHPHENMEIASTPPRGFLAHGDSRKSSRTIIVDDIQVMSARTDVYHSEMSGSKSEPMEFLRIWIVPKERNTHPLYQGYDTRGLLKKNELALILSPDGSTPIKLLQDTWLSMGETETDRTPEYKTHGTDTGVYVFLIGGGVEIDDTILTHRDGLGISETKSFEIETLKNSKMLLIEVPM